MPTLTALKSTPLAGHVTVPGDKSISHRALMLGAVALGETRIAGLLEGEDVLATAAAMRAMGAQVAKLDDGTWVVHGLGVGGLLAPHENLDMGNSGTAARLLMGLVAGHAFSATFTGDASLSSRPMKRVMDPLAQVGATFEATTTDQGGGRLPLTVTGALDPMPITYELPVASAQVKSAVLLAGLNAPGETVVIEPKPTRDHTEKMLAHFGAYIRVQELNGENGPKGGRRITLMGRPELKGRDVIVPADISSAAFPLVAGAIVAGSDVTVEGVGLNPLRAGVIETLKDFGADIAIQNPRVEAGEDIGDVRVRAGALTACTVPAARAPAQIDEYPILFVAAACARGTTRFEGLEELRVKESDRLAVMAQGLAACGVEIREGEDWLEVTGVGGTGKAVPGGATVGTHLDHRIAMSFLVLGLVADAPITVDDASPINTSFPGFQALMESLGATFETGEAS